MPASHPDSAALKRWSRQRGFSLVEIIVVLVVAGFFGVVMVNLLGTQLLKSSSPVSTAQNAAQAEADMEGVISYYITKVNSSTSDVLTDVKNHFAGNSTLSFADNPAGTFLASDGLVSVTVTVTVGKVVLTSVLTQQRTNAADKVVTY